MLREAVWFNGQTPIMVVAAHPDDETLGFGGQLQRPVNATFVYSTDGAPRNGEDARAHGFSGWQDYAAQRRRELRAALALTALPRVEIREIGIPDQQTAFHIRDLIVSLSAQFLEVRPAAILTHPFEGGHPDHDATALAVHVARHQCLPEADVFEFTSYHLENGSLVAGRFLHPESDESFSIELSPAASDLKRRMVDCFTTQADFIRQLMTSCERFRPSPQYDFTCRPHSGPLFYETWDSGMTWQRWLSCIGDLRDDSERRLSVRTS